MKHLLPPGTTSLIIGSLIFLTAGIVVIVKPTNFAMIGGTGRSGAPSFTTLFSENETQGFGYVFLLLGFIIAYFAYRHYKSYKE